MKKTLRFAMVALMAMFVGNTVSAGTKWVKTDASELKTGDVVVIVDQTSSKAMPNDKGTSSAPNATAITLNGDKSEIAETVAENLQWTVTANNGEYQFGVGENYLYCTASNNGVRVGSNENNKFKWEADPENSNSTEPYLINIATTRYIGVYNEQDWRCYTSINNNIKATVTAFYKQVDDQNAKEDAGLSWSAATCTATINAENEFPTLSNPNSLAVTYASSNEAAATVSASPTDGALVIELVAAGTTEISAIFEGNDAYNAQTVKFTLTVKEPDDPNKKGSATNPYTVEDLLAMEVPSNTNATNDQEKVWVKGIIVGAVANDNGVNVIQAETEVATNIALAATSGETDFANTIPVQLPTGEVRTALNIVNNPTLVGQEVAVYGYILKYFTVTGVKNVSDYNLSNPTGITATKVINTADAAVYNMAGQRVNNLQKGIYIQNGKKFVVK